VVGGVLVVVLAVPAAGGAATGPMKIHYQWPGSTLRIAGITTVVAESRVLGCAWQRYSGGMGLLTAIRLRGRPRLFYEVREIDGGRRRRVYRHETLEAARACAETLAARDGVVCRSRPL
jgi:hypothetical protein